MFTAGFHGIIETNKQIVMAEVIVIYEELVFLTTVPADAAWNQMLLIGGGGGYASKPTNLNKTNRETGFDEPFLFFTYTRRAFKALNPLKYYFNF